jgi:hypothetical protein
MLHGGMAHWVMSNRQQPKKSTAKKKEVDSSLTRNNQFSQRRLHDLATQSTLSRLRNRKSDLK